MRKYNAAIIGQHGGFAGVPEKSTALRREDLERLIPAKLSEILLGVVARHPDLMTEVVEYVTRAQKTSPKTEPPDESMMVGSCPVMMKVYERIRRYSLADAPVLICGESGTGKELAAKAIHERSHFSRGPFIAVNCGGLPESLVASELFGYERGAFTGATERRIGRIEAANGGTLFLDEIGDMPLAVQPQLLRFLQEMSFRRVGGKDLNPVNLRVIAATNVNLEQAIQEGRFRKDLYFRLNVLCLTLPPLRERVGDVDILVRYLVDRIAAEQGLEHLKLTPAALNMLRAYDWPGNIRELTSTVRRAIIMADRETVDIKDFEFSHDSNVQSQATELTPNLRAARARSEKPSMGEVQRILAENANNVTQTARYFGVSRVTIYKWLKSSRQ